MSTSGLCVYFVGDADHVELRAFTDALRRAAGRYVQCSGVSQALEELGQGPVAPDCIVLAPLWPGQFTDGDVHALLRRCPLARIVWCLTSWSQGGGRGIVRGVGNVCVAHPGAAARLVSQLSILGQASLPALGLPPTAGAEEQLEHALAAAGMAGSARATALRRPRQDDAQLPTTAAPIADRVAVACDDSETAAVLAEACERFAGHIFVGTLVDMRGVTVDCLLWDATPWSARRRGELAAYRRAHPEVPVIALTDFPRPELCKKLLDSGATTLLTKPLLLSDLAMIPDLVKRTPLRSH